MIHRKTYTVEEAVHIIGIALIDLEFTGPPVFKFSIARTHDRAVKLLSQYLPIEEAPELEVPMALVHAIVAHLIEGLPISW